MIIIVMRRCHPFHVKSVSCSRLKNELKAQRAADETLFLEWNGFHSFVHNHSNTTWCYKSYNATFLQKWWTNKTTCWMAWEWVLAFSANFHFGVNSSFNASPVVNITFIKMANRQVFSSARHLNIAIVINMSSTIGLGVPCIHAIIT